MGIFPGFQHDFSSGGTKTLARDQMGWESGVVIMMPFEKLTSCIRVSGLELQLLAESQLSYALGGSR